MMSTGSGDGLQNGSKVRERDETLKIRSKLVIIEWESEEREKVSNSDRSFPPNREMLLWLEFSQVIPGCTDWQTPICTLIPNPSK